MTFGILQNVGFGNKVTVTMANNVFLFMMVLQLLPRKQKRKLANQAPKPKPRARLRQKGKANWRVLFWGVS